MASDLHFEDGGATGQQAPGKRPGAPPHPPFRDRLERLASSGLLLTPPHIRPLGELLNITQTPSFTQTNEIRLSGTGPRPCRGQNFPGDSAERSEFRMHGSQVKSPESLGTPTHAFTGPLSISFNVFINTRGRSIEPSHVTCWRCGSLTSKATC